MTCHNDKEGTFTIGDTLWAAIKPIVEALCPRNKLGCPRMDDRQALTAIFFILRTGIQWKALPRQYGAKSTVYDRFRYFARQGLFIRLWQDSVTLYDEFHGIDWEFLAMDGCHSMAPLGGKDTGPSYKHRGKSGVNRSLLTDGEGIPIALVVDKANCNDMLLAEPTLNAFVIPRPDPTLTEQHLCLDKGYDYPDVDKLLDRLHFVPHIRRKGIDYSDVYVYVADHKARRWVVERSHSWFNRFRRIILRWEKRADTYLSFMHLACSIIIYRKLDLS
jgi:putative transposase